MSAGSSDRPRILLTGARGQLGQDLARRFAPLGALTAVGREELDLTRAAAIRDLVRAVRPALIVNAAAYTAVDTAESEPAIAHAVNTAAPGLLAEEAARLGAGIIHVSTDYVFDGEKGAPYLETDEPNPLGVYGRTKLEGERAVAVADGHLVLRTSWVYGVRGRTFLSRMVRGTDLPSELCVVNDQFSVPTWVAGLADAMTTLVGRLASDPGGTLERIRTVAGTYHLASSGGGASPYEFAQAVLSLESRPEARERRLVPIASSEVRTAARRPRDTRLDSSLAEAVLGVRIPDWREQLPLAMAR